MSWLEQRWYRREVAPEMWLLLPLTLLFKLLVWLRLWLFKLGVKKQHKIPAIVIVVGNISVGGNGKTPLVILLAKWLMAAGYQPGILSRGYGGKADSYPHFVTPACSAQVIGDEPVLIRRNLTCPMIVDPVRYRGAMALVKQYQCNVILCDDGLQHYALGRDIEIAVVDGVRRFGNGWMLPMGPLREPVKRLKKANFTVVNGGTAQADEHQMTLQPDKLVNVKSPQQTQLLQQLKQPVIAAAAIGNPQRFFNLLTQQGVVLKQQLGFADHHPFSPGDLPRETLLMTEKDAVKCQAFADENWWFLPVNAQLDDSFKQQLLAKLAEFNP